MSDGQGVQPTDNSKSLRLSRGEIALVTAFFFMSWWMLTKFGGGLITSDEMHYLNLAINTEPLPYIANRYFHIYSLKLFLQFIEDPLTAARAYWGFVVSGTAVMLYLATRWLAGRNGWVSGLVALFLYFAQPGILPLISVVYADFTVMFWVTVGWFVLLIRHRASGSRARWWLLFGFGIALLLAFKSKETAATLAVLGLTLVFDDDGRVDLRNLFFKMVPAGLGIATGLMVINLLDLMILRDPAFAVSGESIGAVTEFYNLGADDLIYWIETHFLQLIFVDFARDWFLYALKLLPLTFLLYLVMGFRLPADGHFTRIEKLLWLIPVTEFILLVLIRGGTRLRHITLSVPIIVMWAALAIPVQNLSLRSDLQIRHLFFKRELWLGLGLLALLVLYPLEGRPGALFLSWGVQLGLVVAVVLALIVRDWKPSLTILAIVALALNAWPGLVLDGLIPVVSGEYRTRGDVRFEPLKHIPFEMNCRDAEARYYYSGSITAESQGVYLGYTPFDLMRMINIWFRCSTRQAQFVSEREPNLPDALLTEESFDVALLSRSDYRLLSQKDISALELTYEIFYDPDLEFVYLKSR